ncbi:hypothetical protein ACFXK0_16900 [Nocardia sp. NPDC059177]|uniref:hypothetical protein n=1 Tax=Nocardia sp. NPDC059177 TaxID=3346759 RepID=UPI0036BE5495
MERTTPTSGTSRSARGYDVLESILLLAQVLPLATAALSALVDDGWVARGLVVLVIGAVTVVHVLRARVPAEPGRSPENERTGNIEDRTRRELQQ